MAVACMGQHRIFPARALRACIVDILDHNEGKQQLLP
jgi:hypothetical protein